MGGFRANTSRCGAKSTLARGRPFHVVRWSPGRNSSHGLPSNRVCSLLTHDDLPLCNAHLSRRGGGEYVRPHKRVKPDFCVHEKHASTTMHPHEFPAKKK